MNPSKKVITKLHTLQPEVQQRFHARIDGIFGSYAKGTETVNSDLDLLVTFLPKATLFDFAELGDFLSTQLGITVDVVSRNAIRKKYRQSILDNTKWI
jgi:uncharacterized protein